MTMISVSSEVKEVIDNEEDQVPLEEQTLKDRLIKQELQGLKNAYLPNTNLEWVIRSDDYSVNEDFFMKMEEAERSVDEMIWAANCPGTLSMKTWEELNEYGIRAGKIDGNFALAIPELTYAPELFRQSGVYYELSDEIQNDLRQDGLWMCMSLQNGSLNLRVRNDRGNIFEHFHGGSSSCLGGDDMGLDDFTLKDVTKIDFLIDRKELLERRYIAINGDSLLKSHPSSLPHNEEFLREFIDENNPTEVERRNWNE